MTLIVIIDERNANRTALARFSASLGQEVAVRTFAEPQAAFAALDGAAPDLILAGDDPPASGAVVVRLARESAA
ncbi:MAG TPA: hypothetical protein VIL72_03690, partial [Beijerinckiaceae bacterium]